MQFEIVITENDKKLPTVTESLGSSNVLRDLRVFSH